MTGPDHFREAERCLDLAEDQAAGGHDHSEAMALANAQVHATLALAAATAVPFTGGLCAADREAWQAAAGNGPAWHDRPPGGGTGE